MLVVCMELVSPKAGCTVSLQKASRRKSCSDIDIPTVAPLASQEAVDQLDGPIHEVSEEDEEPDVVRISPRSDSPRGGCGLTFPPDYPQPGKGMMVQVYWLHSTAQTI